MPGTRSTPVATRCLPLVLALLAAATAAFSQTPSGLQMRGDAPPPRSLSLQECVQLALQQNSDILLARLDQQSADSQVRRVSDPLSLKLGIGSGLAYSSGFPMNVGGSGPSIVNAQASLTLYDRALRFRVAEARERAKATGMTEKEKQAAVALDVARLFLDAETLSHTLESLKSEVEALERLSDIRRMQLQEGRALSLDEKRARAAAAAARYRMREMESSLVHAQLSLAFLLGMDAGVRVVPTGAERVLPEIPRSLEEATASALSESPQLAQIEIQLAANRFRSKAASATRWPIVRMVSQYSMFSRFNNYDDFYNRFERHNGQIGASFELPLFTGSAARAEVSETTIEADRLRLQELTTQRRIALEAQDAFRRAEDAQAYREVASLDLEAARENVSVLLARVDAGRARLAELEEARSEESRKWVEYYQSKAAAERAAYELLHKTGRLVALFR